MVRGFYARMFLGDTSAPKNTHPISAEIDEETHD